MKVGDKVTVLHGTEPVFATVDDTWNQGPVYLYHYTFPAAQEGFDGGRFFGRDQGRIWLPGWSEENKAILGATAALDTETTQLQQPGGFFGGGVHPPEVAHWIIAPRRT